MIFLEDSAEWRHGRDFIVFLWRWTVPRKQFVIYGRAEFGSKLLSKALVVLRSGENYNQITI